MGWLEELSEEQKNCLKKDLCARLPYGVKCKYYDCCIGDFGEGTIRGFERHDRFEIDGVCIRVDDIRPYLFPLSMSSMTEEQKEDMVKSSCGIGSDKNVFDWYNKNHFDYRGLIPMGLANDATNLNIYQDYV